MPILKDVGRAESALQHYLAATSDTERHRIYPEIWRSLDSALAEARTEGKDTSRIDAVRTRLGVAALEHPPPPDESGIEAARQAFAWFRTHYAALQFGADESIPNLGPSKLKKTMVYGIAGAILILCAIGYVIARIGMRSY